jgi:hypothetical protein
MTDKEINHRIAELCGWTEIHDSAIWHNFKPWGYPPEKPGQGGNSYNFLPDYCTDLNAMHEAEKMLDFNQLRDMEDNVSFRFAVLPFHATAAQRAEAFLRTLGKWEEPV